ncbi:MAG TPA: hypothetical protein VMW09_07020 [Desulfatiglandales bacterium]|nr:hypothetical protein [Desulfatiglandales bacterium]
MGTGLKIFLVNDDDSLQRFPLARFERLIDRDPKELLPQYAGKRVRYALVIADLVNRKPVEILRIQYSILTFDSEGKIDAAEREKEMRLGVDMVPIGKTALTSLKVVDAEHHFLQKRYENRYLWRPTPEIEEAIAKALFG